MHAWKVRPGSGLIMPYHFPSMNHMSKYFFQVIEESCEVSTKCLDGVEAVEAARRRVTDLQDATEASASHTSKTDFQK